VARVKAAALLDEERLRRVIERAGVPEGDVDDVLQDVLIRIWQKQALVDASDDPEVYTAQIARHHAYDYHRRARGRQETAVSLEDHDHDPALGDRRPGPEECVIGRQHMGLMWHFINALPPDLRSLFIARELEDKPLAEIAAEHGLKTSGAEKRIARAWDAVERAVVRWRADQQRRGRHAVRCVLLLLLEIDHVALLRKLGRRVVGGAAMAAIVLLAGGLAGPHPGCATAIASFRPASRFSSRVTGVLANVMAPMDDAPHPAAKANEESSEGRSTAVSAPVARAPSSKARDASAGDEEELIDRARAALAIGGSHADLQALALLQEHRERYRNGRFAAVRESLLRELLYAGDLDDG
jgi:RNA polymerase sigma-70 factor, ECF subfamily